jgi:hypothetical protein
MYRLLVLSCLAATTTSTVWLALLLRVTRERYDATKEFGLYLEQERGLEYEIVRLAARNEERMLGKPQGRVLPNSPLVERVVRRLHAPQPPGIPLGGP